MAKKKKESGKQEMLIDVLPEDAKPIIEAARDYKKHQKVRLAALKKEVELKQRILDLVNKAKLQRLKDGKIRFEYDGVKITVTPTDDKIDVKEKE